MVVLGISAVVCCVEFAAGLLTNSLALLADAGHVLADVAGITLALFAIWLANRPPSATRTFGLYRAEILAATVNGAILIGLSGLILLESWRRFSDPPEIASGVVIIVATLGLGANLVSAWVLRRAQAESLNMRGAYLEVLADAVASVAVLGAGVVVLLTGFRAADALASAGIALFILPRAVHLLKEAVDILLETTPRDCDVAEVRRHILETPGVLEVHDLHAWMITSGMPVLSAHVVVRDDANAQHVLGHLNKCLAKDFDISHSTLQLESPARRRREGVLHA